MVKLSKRDLQIIAGVIGAADFYYEGALTAPLSRAIKKALGRAKPVATRGAIAGARAIGSTAVRGVGTVAAVGRTVAMRHPYIAAGAVIYVAAKNREQIADLIREGYDVVSDELAQHPMGFKTPSSSIIPEVFLSRPKKRMTDFNKAVKKGMSIVKGSTSYGKKGTINNAKKAFAAVTKVASAASKKKKAAKKGIQRKIYLGIKGLFK